MKMPAVVRDAVVYVARTSCCGLKVQSPYDLAKPAHPRAGGIGYTSCTILEYWEFKAAKRWTP